MCSAPVTGRSKNPGLLLGPQLVCFPLLLFLGQFLDLLDLGSLSQDFSHLLNLLMGNTWVAAISCHVSLPLTIIACPWGPLPVDIHWLPLSREGHPLTLVFFCGSGWGWLVGFPG